MRQAALTFMLVGIIIDIKPVSAEFRWNPFAASAAATAELPPPLVLGQPPTLGVPGSAPRFSMPSLEAPQLSLPDVSLPKLSIPNVTLPRMSIPQMSLPTLPLLELPELRSQGSPRVFQRIEEEGQRFWGAAKAPFRGMGLPARQGFLPGMRPATLKTPVLKRPVLTKPNINLPVLSMPSAGPAGALPRLGAGRNAATEERPTTITGWLAQPRPE